MAIAIKQMFTAQGADGSSAWYTVQGGEAQFAHQLVVGALGALGGGTLKLEISFDQPTVQTPVLIATLVASIGLDVAQTGLTLPPGCRVRVTLTGSTAPNLNVYFME